METVSIRYIVDDVDAAADFYVRQLGFEVQQDLEATVARLRDGGARFRSGIVQGNGGRQALVADPSGNLIELFEPTDSDTLAS